ncbi:MAG: hypothetical protein HYX24_04140 [Candidatus Aenigmarchaeota archaeon]|nr:hypothetical protein [Candidatus Aenigmarchaeota archaeon]
MSENVLKVIDNASSKGLWAMLEAIETAGEEEFDFSLAAQARIEQEKIRLRLSDAIGKPEDFNEEDAQRWLRIASFGIHFREGEDHKKHGNYRAAGEAYETAGNLRTAIEMYLKDNTPDSIRKAASLALSEGLDPKLGIDLRIKAGEAYHAFEDLREAAEKLSPVERQKWGDYIVKSFYRAVVERVRREVEKQTHKKPREGVITQMLEGGKKIFIAIYDIEREILESISYSMKSTDREVIQIGLDLLSLQEYCENRASSLPEGVNMRKVMLEGRLPEYAEQRIQYLLSIAGKGVKGPVFDDDYAVSAVQLLNYHGRPVEAFQTAERFLEPGHPLRIEFIESVGDLTRLAAEYREANRPLEYACTLAKIKGRG